jgi:ribonuclease E
LLDNEPTNDTPASGDAAESPAPKRRAARRPAGPPTPTATAAAPPAPEPATAAAADAAPAPVKRTRKKAAAPAKAAASEAAADAPNDAPSGEDAPAAPARRRRTSTAAKKVAASADADKSSESAAAAAAAAPAALPATAVLFQPPPAEPAPARRTSARAAAAAAAGDDAPAPARRSSARAAAANSESASDAGSRGQGDGDDQPDSTGSDGTGSDGADSDGAESFGTNADGTPRSSRRRRGRRGRGGRGTGEGATGPDEGDGEESTRASQTADSGEAAGSAKADGESSGPDDDDDESGTGTHRRRRRRRASGEGPDGSAPSGSGSPDDPPNTVTHVRTPRQIADDSARGDGVRGVKGSTRIEAKRQRRRDGRETQRRRPSIITEAEFLARREAVERVMVVKQGEDRTQIAVLEDNVLVEHYVTRKHQSSMVGNVYLGKVQNVLPSMEAAFVDIGRGRNAVLYAGEVNYDASALEGGAPRIEQALKSGQSVLVQVTKDPIGQKGARLTSQVSLPGRYMVYVPDGRLSGISRKLPDTERTRLKSILKRLTPEDAGVIIRTAAEGASEEALERDLNRLRAQWEDIDKKSQQTSTAPTMIYGEPDLVIRVIRDIFNEDFNSLVVQGADEWETIDNYVRWVAPDLAERSRRWTEDEDVFAAYRVDEQLAKALDRKVWLPSGGYLVIDHTEAMYVVDVNTGKFTGKGGNLEETVTKNNLEAAEEVVRQLRLRDIGGIIVIDFIDMVLESNRDLVLRRVIECLGRDRTRHQVAEVTSLGLVQMTRKRVGEGLLESFSETCQACSGSGVILTQDPVAQKRPPKSKRSKSNDHQHEVKPNGQAASKPAESAAPSLAESSAESSAEPASSGSPAEPASGSAAVPEPIEV